MGSLKMRDTRYITLNSSDRHDDSSGLTHHIRNFVPLRCLLDDVIGYKRR